MSKQKILIFIEWYYPAFKAGGPVRSVLNFAEKLNKEFDLHVVAGNREYLETTPMPGLVSDTWQEGKFGERVMYLSSADPGNIGKILNKLKPDAIWLNSMFSNSYSIIPMRLWKGKTVLSPRGMLAPEALKIKKTKKAVYLKLAGLMGWHKHVIFHATNSGEASQIRKYFPNNEVRVAPNFPSPLPPPGLHPEKKENLLRLVMLARLAPEKNNLFAIELMKDWKPEGKIIFDLYGSVYDQEYFSKCRQEAGNLDKNISVQFMGALAQDKVYEVLRQYDFLILPSRGENYGHAIVQSWNAGTPVLISDATPWKDLKKYNTGWEIANDSKVVWREVLKNCLSMGTSEYARMSADSLTFATRLAQDGSILVLNQNLFR